MSLNEVGYSDVKLNINVDDPVSKSLGQIFGITVDEKSKKENTGLDPNKPGLGTLLKQLSLFIGDIFGFIFSMFKKLTDQIKTSFIMPIIMAGMPFTTPALILNIFKLIMGIVSLIKESLSMVTDTVNWVLKKVAGKLLELNIPIPKFDLSLFGIMIPIPALDMLKISNLEPFSTKSSDKIKEVSTKIKDTKNQLNSTPINQLTKKKMLNDKLSDLNKETDKELKKDNVLLDKMISEILKLENDKTDIIDSEDQNVKNMLYSALRALTVSLELLKNIYFQSVIRMFDLVIEVHDEIIMKKKEYFDIYLKSIVNDKTNTNVISDYSTSNIQNILSNSGITYNNFTNGNIELGVVKGNTTNINDDINYIISTKTTDFTIDNILSGVTIYNPIRNINYKVSYLTYTFRNRIDIILNTKQQVDKDKVVVREYKNKNKTEYVYKYVGDFNYLKTLPSFLLDELDKEEYDLEQDINKYKPEDGTSFKQKIQLLDDKLNQPFIKILKPSEQYYTPVLSDFDKDNLIKIGQIIPKDGLLVTEIQVSGYTQILLNLKITLDDISNNIKDLEKSITDLKSKINSMGKSDSNELNKDGNDNKEDNCCMDIVKKPLSKENQEKIDKINKEIEDKKNLILSIFPPSVLSGLQLVKMLIGVIKFPISIIVKLITELMCGIIEFITSLPLLKFEKIMKFFTSLLTLPNPILMTPLVMETIISITGEQKDFIKPITNIVDTVPTLITGVLDQFVKGVFKKEVPFPM